MQLRGDQEQLHADHPMPATRSFRTPADRSKDDTVTKIPINLRIKPIKNSLKAALSLSREKTCGRGSKVQGWFQKAVGGRLEKVAPAFRRHLCIKPAQRRGLFFE